MTVPVTLVTLRFTGLGGTSSLCSCTRLGPGLGSMSSGITHTAAIEKLEGPTLAYNLGALEEGAAGRGASFEFTTDHEQATGALFAVRVIVRVSGSRIASTAIVVMTIATTTIVVVTSASSAIVVVTSVRNAVVRTISATATKSRASYISVSPGKKVTLTRFCG